MNQRTNVLRVALLLAIDGFLLVTLRPNWSTLGRHLTAPHAWVAAVGSDSAAGELGRAALWLIGCWIAAGLLAVAVAIVPGRPGALGRGCARMLLPRFAQRVFGVAVGLGVVLTPLAASAAPAPGASPTATVSAPSGTPGWPTTPPSTAAPAPGTVTPSASPPTTGAPTPTAPAPTTPVPQSPTGEQTVRPGDSLWLIAAHRLGGHPSDRQITAEWQRWYAANRGEIGTNPSLLHPGLVLNVPEEN